MRVSNFLLWQIAYAEIWVTETLWPDFRRRHLLEAVVAYQKRDRRYGGIKPPPVALGAVNSRRHRVQVTQSRARAADDPSHQRRVARRGRARGSCWFLRSIRCSASR